MYIKLDTKEKTLTLMRFHTDEEIAEVFSMLTSLQNFESYKIKSWIGEDVSSVKTREEVSFPNVEAFTQLSLFDFN